ncbi:MAG: SixA phosphatase family protein [Acidimicrobiales bacterium]
MLRHAKAASDSPDSTDHARPLTKRGRAQGEAAARYVRELHDEGVRLPHLVLTSSAVRARQTADLVLPALGTEVTLEVERDLYEADADDIIGRLRELDDVAGSYEVEGSETTGTATTGQEGTTGKSPDSVMVVGHNPAFGDLVDLLVSQEDGEGRSKLGSFPTCALAHIELPVSSWSELEGGIGRLERLFVP